MHSQEHFNETAKSVAAFVSSAITGMGAFIGLPEFMTPEVIAASASAIMALAGVFYMVKRLSMPAPVEETTEEIM